MFQLLFHTQNEETPNLTAPADNQPFQMCNFIGKSAILGVTNYIFKCEKLLSEQTASLSRHLNPTPPFITTSILYKTM